MNVKRDITVKGKNNQIDIGVQTKLNDAKITIFGNHNHLSVAQGCYLACNFELIGDDNVISVGQSSLIGVGTLMAHGGRTIRLGDGCLFSVQFSIRTTDNHPIFDEQGQRVNPDESVLIGDRVWLGTNVHVLRGVQIGNDVCIGLGSVVTRDIPANCVAAGVPARVVRTGTTWRML